MLSDLHQVQYTTELVLCIKKSTMKLWHGLDQNLNLPLFSYGYQKRMFVDYLTEYICHFKYVHYWVWFR